MRIRLPLGRGLFFLCALLIALIALLPMRLALEWLALDRIGLSARGAGGSIWLGDLKEARFGEAPLGDLSAQLSPVQLLVGRARIDLRGDGPGKTEGAIGVTRNSFGIDDMSASVPVGAVFSPLPVESLDMNDVSVRFVDGLCERADGNVRAVLAGDIAGLALTQGMTGNARCEGGALLLPLQSQSGMERLRLRLFEDGRYALDLSVRPADPAMGAKLALAGFRENAGGYVFSLEGRF